MKKLIGTISIKIALLINKFRKKLEIKKHLRITRDIINLPYSDRKRVLERMRYRFRKNKTRGAFIMSWCDDMEFLGDKLDEQRKEYGDSIKINITKIQEEYVTAEKRNSQ